MIDIAFAALAAGLCVLVAARVARCRSQPIAVGALEGCAVAAAVASATRIRVVGELIDQTFRGAAVTMLLGELAVTAAAALLAGAGLSAVQYSGGATPRPGSRWLTVTGPVLLAVATVAVVTAWGIATAVGGSVGAVVLAGQALGYQLLVMTLTGIVIDAAVERTGQLPAGTERQVVTLFGAAAGLMFLEAGWEAVVQVGQLDGRPIAAPAFGLNVALQLLGGVVLLAAFVLPLTRVGSVHDDQTHHDVAALWSWLSDHPTDRRPTRAEGDLFSMVIDIRDQVWRLQRRIQPAHLAATAGLARGLGLHGATARAYMLAVCLQIARTSTTDTTTEPDDGAADQVPADPDPARATAAVDLSRLGGGELLSQEARWLAAVHRARTQLPAHAGAVLLLGRHDQRSPAPHLHTPHPDRRSARPAAAQTRPGPQQPDRTQGRSAASRADARGPDPALIERCQQRLLAALPTPPRTLEDARAAVARGRERPLSIVVTDPRHLVLPIGMWLHFADHDVIWIDRRTSPLSRILTGCHELGHLICGHTPTTLAGALLTVPARDLADTLSLDPASLRSIMARCGQPHPEGTPGWEIEQEAEYTGQIIARRLLAGHRPPAWAAVALGVP
ncbi:DUF6545 domain-containing protein [uncultured Pseudonocardia sp.]|uniref:DUF6545 domain-containing protein n=1 Tax=uncultured Pseudonocardia sp. TaxID=211455 RepID=UPI00345BBB97